MNETKRNELKENKQQSENTDRRRTSTERVPCSTVQREQRIAKMKCIAEARNMQRQNEKRSNYQRKITWIISYLFNLLEHHLTFLLNNNGHEARWSTQPLWFNEWMRLLYGLENHTKPRDDSFFCSSVLGVAVCMHLVRFNSHLSLQDFRTISNDHLPCRRRITSYCNYRIHEVFRHVTKENYRPHS